MALSGIGTPNFDIFAVSSRRDQQLSPSPNATAQTPVATAASAFALQNSRDVGSFNEPRRSGADGNTPPPPAAWSLSPNYEMMGVDSGTVRMQECVVEIAKTLMASGIPPETATVEQVRDAIAALGSRNAIDPTLAAAPGLPMLMQLALGRFSAEHIVTGTSGDLNGDGVEEHITRDEIRMDLDGDGAVDVAETLQSADTNGDGFIDSQCQTRGRDLNGDGAFDEYHQEIVELRDQDFDGVADDIVRTTATEVIDQFGVFERVAKVEVDRDADGTVDEKHWAAYYANRDGLTFEQQRFDFNNDGIIDYQSAITLIDSNQDGVVDETTTVITNT